MNEQFYISIRISLKYISKGPIVNQSAFVHVVVWHYAGDKLTQFTDAYMQH